MAAGFSALRRSGRTVRTEITVMIASPLSLVTLKPLATAVVGTAVADAAASVLADGGLSVGCVHEARTTAAPMATAVSPPPSISTTPR